MNLIGGIRSVFGEAGLDRLIEARQEAAVAASRSALEPCSGLEDRVRIVARLRTEEGYMAEFEAEPSGSFLLIENHFSSHRKSLSHFAQRPKRARASAGQS